MDVESGWSLQAAEAGFGHSLLAELLAQHLGLAAAADESDIGSGARQCRPESLAITLALGRDDDPVLGCDAQGFEVEAGSDFIGIRAGGTILGECGDRHPIAETRSKIADGEGDG